MSHLIALFEGTDLSEEFKVKAEAILQTAIEEGVTAQVEEAKLALEEGYKEQTEKRLAELDEAAGAYIEEAVMPTIDKYLTAAVAEWLKENEVPLAAKAKVELAESFLTGLAGLAAEHKLSLPEGEDKTVALQAQIDELSEKTKELLEKNIELQNENVNHQKAQVFAVATAALSESQREKLEGVAAKVEFKDAAQYGEALKSLAESYFPTAETVETPVEKEKVEVKAPIVESAEDAYVLRLRAQAERKSGKQA